ncbi:MAG: 2'-5' RNA ligase family protein [Balneolaceae bacterium]
MNASGKFEQLNKSQLSCHRRNRSYILFPPFSLQEKIEKLKYYVRDTFDSSHSLNAPPHLTLLAPFNVSEGNEKELANMLDNLCKNVEPLKITLHDFSNFPPRVIFIDVKKSEDLMHLQAEMEELARNHPEIFNYHYHEREFNPHVTLAFRDLSKANFKRAWWEFEGKEFREEFIAEKISLLRHEDKKWEVAEEFELVKKDSTDKRSKKRLP